MLEKSNRHRTKLNLFTWVNSLCMQIFTVNGKGTAKFCTEKKLSKNVLNGHRQQSNGAASPHHIHMHYSLLLGFHSRPASKVHYIGLAEGVIIIHASSIPSDKRNCTIGRRSKARQGIGCLSSFLQRELQQSIPSTHRSQIAHSDMHHPVCGINSRILFVSLASHVSTHRLIHLSAHLYYHHHSHHPSLLHSFTPGSKPTFSTNPSHLRFLLPTRLLS